MTDAIQAAPGNNNAAGLSTLDPQPDFDGIDFPRVTHAGDGMDYDDGWQFVELRFPDMVTPADWVGILGKFGLGSARSALVTIRIPNTRKTVYANYNGIATYRHPRHAYCWYEAPVIVVKKLEAL